MTSADQSDWEVTLAVDLVTPIHRGRLIDCATGEHFTFTGTSTGTDDQGPYILVHGRNGKWSTSATLRPGDVVRVQAKEARA